MKKEKFCPNCSSKNIALDVKLPGVRYFCKDCGFYGPQGFEFPIKSRQQKRKK